MFALQVHHASRYHKLALDAHVCTVACDAVQVQRHPVLPQRAAEFPSVAPAVTGKPHRHAYTACSRVVGENKWGPQQASRQISSAFQTCTLAYQRIVGPLAGAHLPVIVAYQRCPWRSTVRARLLQKWMGMSSLPVFTACSIVSPSGHVGLKWLDCLPFRRPFGLPFRWPLTVICWSSTVW